MEKLHVLDQCHSIFNKFVEDLPDEIRNKYRERLIYLRDKVIQTDCAWCSSVGSQIYKSISESPCTHVELLQAQEVRRADPLYHASRSAEREWWDLYKAASKEARSLLQL